MNTATVTPVDRLAAYRSNHRIQVEPVADGRYRCAVDGVRVHEGRRSWRHDTAELAELIKAEYGGTWPSRTVAIDAVAAAVASDIAREDAFENGRITLDWRGHGVDVDLA